MTHIESKLIAERDAALAHVTALQADATKARDALRSVRVREFHAKFGHPVATTPAVPEDAQVRFRIALIAEEFVELLDACFVTDETIGDFMPKDWTRLKEELAHFARVAPINVNLADFADAMEDLDYVVEGTRAVFGVHAAPLAAAVHAANMAKDAVQVAEKDASMGSRIKPVKPPGWKPPDIYGLLIEQGWRPPFDHRGCGAGGGDE